MERQLRLDNKKLYTVNFQIWVEISGDPNAKGTLEETQQWRYTSLAESGTDIIKQAQSAIDAYWGKQWTDTEKIVWLDIREG